MEDKEPFLIQEMRETPEVIRGFDLDAAGRLFSQVEGFSRVVLTGEGSSRLFPGHAARDKALRWNAPVNVICEGCRQAGRWKLDGALVIGMSHSGRTRELVDLLRALRGSNAVTLGITAHAGTPVLDLSTYGHVLSSGEEKAVAATKSVVEQALVLDAFVRHMSGQSNRRAYEELARAARTVLDEPIAADLTERLAKASHVYFCGAPEGPAAELALKAVEIVRKPSVHLEGTLVLHGYEEVMGPDDLVVLCDPCDPCDDDGEAYDRVLKKGAGADVIAIADRPTRFPTLQVPQSSDWSGYLQLMAGWMLLARCGQSMGLDVDQPARARKVGYAADEG